MDDGERLHVPTPCIMRGAIMKFAPPGFYPMILRLAQDNHPNHDRFYEGGAPQTIDTPNGPVVRSINLVPLAKRQFEPVLEIDVPPLSMAEQDLRSHIKKRTGNSTVNESTGHITIKFFGKFKILKV